MGKDPNKTISEVVSTPSGNEELSKDKETISDSNTNTSESEVNADQKDKLEEDDHGFGTVEEMMNNLFEKGFIKETGKRNEYTFQIGDDTHTDQWEEMVSDFEIDESKYQSLIKYYKENMLPTKVVTPVVSDEPISILMEGDYGSNNQTVTNKTDLTFAFPDAVTLKPVYLYPGATISLSNFHKLTINGGRFMALRSQGHIVVNKPTDK